MGPVWAVRRSLRLLTLLTLMASALCSGQSLAAQENAAPRVTLADSVADQPPPVLVATDVFAGESAVTLASAISTTDAAFHPAFSFTATLTVAPPAATPLLDHFSPPAERAPPVA